jgi:hypothetical protein
MKKSVVLSSCVVVYIVIDVSEEHVSSIFKIKEGESGV